MPYTLTLTNGDPLNTTLTSSDGTPTYTIKSPKKVFGNRITTVTRVNPAGNTIVATLEWIYPYGGRSTVEFYGNTKQNVRKFLIEKKQLWPPEWYMKCADGKEYKWVNWNNLIDSSTEAKAKFTQAGFEFKGMRWRKAMVEINVDDAQSDKEISCRVIDQIVVAIVFTETWRRESSRYPIDA